MKLLQEGVSSSACSTTRAEDSNQTVICDGAK
jgi:hypothetical protein